MCKIRLDARPTYSAEELNAVPIPSPSQTVFKHVGAYGVSEPAAKLSSGAEGWVVEKIRSGNVTISVCIVPHRSQANEAPEAPSLPSGEGVPS